MHTISDPADFAALRERLLALHREDLRHWGVMDAGQMVCHIRGAFRTAMGEIPCEPIPMPMPRAALKALALWAPLPWKRNFETVPALKLGTPEMAVTSFETDRAEAVADMERFCRPEQVRVDHAFFGPMSYADWMRWGYLHTDHHLRQFGR